MNFNITSLMVVCINLFEPSVAIKSDQQDTVDWGKKWLVDFNAGKTQLVSFDQSNNNSFIDVKKDVS